MDCCDFEMKPKNLTLSTVHEYTVIDPETLEVVELRITRQIFPEPPSDSPKDTSTGQ